MSPMVPGGKGPQIPVGIATGGSDSLIWTVTQVGRSNPALPLVAAERLEAGWRVCWRSSPGIVCGAWGQPHWPAAIPFLWNSDLHWLAWVPFGHWGHSPGLLSQVLYYIIQGGIVTPVLGQEWQSFFICLGFPRWKHLGGEELKLFLKAAQIAWASMVCLWACVPVFWHARTKSARFPFWRIG